MEEQATLNMKLPMALYKALQETAKKKNISLAALVRITMSEYLEQQEKK